MTRREELEARAKGFVKLFNGPVEKWSSIDKDQYKVIMDLLLQVEREAWERAACIAETYGVYPELNVYNGGPDWYKHGKNIAGKLRQQAEALHDKG